MASNGTSTGGRRRGAVTGLIGVVSAAVLILASAAAAMPQAAPGFRCDSLIPPPDAAYGADGPYAMDQATVPNPAFRRQPVRLFLPRGAAGERPVVFFSHGFGPGVWQAYGDLIRHMVSRGDAVVYSTYPVIGATIPQRYDDLWAGFRAAAAQYADRLDLTHVAFVGHSFGGGATPAMAHRGIVQAGWGSVGAFMLELAPWYSYDLPADRLAAIPPRVVQAVEVYDHDVTNDPRMAIDLYDHSRATHRFFFRVRSTAVRGCVLTADHSTPGRNPSLRQKQYGVFRVFDALAAFAFGDSTGAMQTLEATKAAPTTAGYQPLRLESNPTPDDAGRSYRYPWSGAQNPRRSGRP